ncbi:MAG: hypothetical protein H5T63_00020 [Chloroflexi bacterium]|nr:hypothetical protein [Chloroflexota bacterium]
MSLDYREAIPVSSIREEHDYLAAHPCPSCGGRWKIRVQALLVEAQGRHYDRVDVICSQCGERKVFLFDIQSLFTKQKTDK